MQDGFHAATICKVAKDKCDRNARSLDTRFAPKDLRVGDYVFTPIHNVAQNAKPAVSRVSESLDPVP